MRMLVILVFVTLFAGMASAQPAQLHATAPFHLWNASTDQEVDADFEEGEVIPYSLAQCAAIEIVGNAYLEQSSSDGSIKKTFDGNTEDCPSAQYSENEPDYAWPDGGTQGQYGCAGGSFVTPGTHTLTVTPYELDNCGGLAGTTVTINFTVSAPVTRVENVLWTQPAPGAGESTAESWQLFWGTTSGFHEQSGSVVTPTPDANGVYSSSLTVDGDVTVYIIGRSIDASSVYSNESNEIVRTPQQQCPL